MDFMTAAFEESGPNHGDLFDTGGAPLTDHESERQLIGNLMHKLGSMTECIEILQPRDFHDPFHRRLYEVMLQAYEAGEEQVTIESLVHALGDEKSSGRYIADIMGLTDTSLDIAELADYLQQVSERRATGLADDVDWDNGKPFVSRFGAQRFEDIGAYTGGLGYSWFVEDIFPLGEISLVFGDTGSGKSFSMFDVAMCSARNIPWNGHNVEHGLVIYVAAEAGKGFSKRKIAYAIHHKLEPSEPLPFVLLTRRPNLYRDDQDALALIDEFKAIARMYRVPLIAIIFDTLSAIAPGMNENASQDVSAVRARLVMVQEQFTGAAIILVHHKPKSGHTPRGHTSLSDDFETTVEVETVTDRHTDTGGTIHRGTTRKQREGKNNETWEFTLPVVEVGKNKWGKPETSCVVAPYGAPNRKKVEGFHATPTERQFMQALFEALVDHGQPAPAGLPLSIGKVVKCSYVRELMRSRIIASDADTDIAATRFRVAYMRAGNKLRDGGVLGVKDDYFWFTGKPVVGLSGPRPDM
jgi:hypothetical protein